MIRTLPTPDVARTLTARELLDSWGHVRGPEFRDPLSCFLRRCLDHGGLPVYRLARQTRRRAPSAVGRLAHTPDHTPQHSIGATFVWSANSPPALLGA
jgi:hypothetical protein